MTVTEQAITFKGLVQCVGDMGVWKLKSNTSKVNGTMAGEIRSLHVSGWKRII